MAIDIRGLAPLLSVFDMPTSIKFYCEALGFEIVGTDEKPAPNFDWVLLRLNGSELMLNTAYDEGHRPPSPDPARIEAHPDAAIYFGCPDVDGAYSHLREKGINAEEPRIAPNGMKQLYLTDPDGYILCFQWQAEVQERPTDIYIAATSGVRERRRARIGKFGAKYSQFGGALHGAISVAPHTFRGYVYDYLLAPSRSPSCRNLDRLGERPGLRRETYRIGPCRLHSEVYSRRGRNRPSGVEGPTSGSGQRIGPQRLDHRQPFQFEWS